MNETTIKKYISDYVKDIKFKKGVFNLIVAGCGAGKTYWVANDMLNQFEGIKPEEVLFVTSRSMIFDQQSNNDEIVKYDYQNDNDIMGYWNREIDDVNLIAEHGIRIMTLDKLVNILINRNVKGLKTLDAVKIFVIDECHTLLSDRFIYGVEILWVWIKMLIESKDKFIIGMTATPDIIYDFTNWGIHIEEVINRRILINYKAKQLICTDFESLPSLFSMKKLPGKSIIMCVSISDCYKLQAQIPNSAILVGRSNKKEYTQEMQEIRSHIIKTETLPESFKHIIRRDEERSITYSELRDLDVLITTSTMREGVNLSLESGVKNVVCCYSDELHVIQFAGRCRFDIENLVVVRTFIRADNINQSNYLARQRKLFSDFMDDDSNSDTRWFDTIKHMVYHDASKIQKYYFEGIKRSGSKDGIMRFVKYVNERWLRPHNISEEQEKRKYWIYKAEDRKEIVDVAWSYRVCDVPKHRLTYARIMRLLARHLGYEISCERGFVNGKRLRYSCITSFNGDVCKSFINELGAEGKAG